ncbi:MAG: aldo/keto reductase, partial [Clostridia bacterium]|nr:aldo/keto reductase [Clostridia bacterium]
KCHVTYFDNYLVHNLNKENYQIAKQYGAFDFVRKLKREGKVKEFGFSFHDNAELLDIILTEQPDVNYVQLQVNYMDWDSDTIQSAKCCEVASKHGKKIIIMEPVKGGSLANVPKEAQDVFSKANRDASVASWAIRFAASVKDSVMVLSGMSNFEQLNDNISYMKDFKPLNSKEQEAILQVVDIINGTCPIACTCCRYCVDGCPQGINIPECFSIYNADLQSKSDLFASYDNIPDNKKASACIECGQCNHVCPQHLDVMSLLMTVTKRFTK